MYWKEYGKPSPYRMNKKKKPAASMGKFLYKYADENAVGGYNVVEVTEEEWKILVSLDKIEYSNNRRHDEKHTELREYYYDDDEDFSDDGGGKYYSDTNIIRYELQEHERLENFICESLDKGKLVHEFSDKDFSIYILAVEKKMKQNKVAELLGLSESFVSRRINVILHKLLINKMDNGAYSKSRLHAEAEYRWFVSTGKTDSFADLMVWRFLTNLKQELIFRYLYCMYGTYQLFHYCFTFLYRMKDKNPENILSIYLNKLEPYSRKLYDRNARVFGPLGKLLFIFLELKCTDNLKRFGVYEKHADETFIKKVRQTANRCHISVEELREKRLFPFMQSKVEERIVEYRKKYNLPALPKKFMLKKKQVQKMRYQYRFK